MHIAGADAVDGNDGRLRLVAIACERCPSNVSASYTCLLIARDRFCPQSPKQGPSLGLCWIVRTIEGIQVMKPLC